MHPRRLVVGLALFCPLLLACEGSYAAPPVEYAPIASNEDVPAPQTADDQPTGGIGENEYEDTDPSALQDFQAPLSPYGTWLEDPTYGTVWVPYGSEVGADFEPYVSAGHWAYDYDDWIWVSYYPWGWIPFHYGRWAFVGGHGWCWIPGRRYAGAWVNWRAGNGYVGWAPAAPTFGWRDRRAFNIEHPAEARYVYRRGGEMFASSPSNVIRGKGAEEIGGTLPYRNGPSPQTLGIAPQSIVRTQPSDQGVARARELATARGAARQGGQPPAQPVARRPTQAPTPAPAPQPRPQTYPQPERVVPPAQRVAPQSERVAPQPARPAPMPAPRPAPMPAPAPRSAPHFVPSPHVAPHGAPPAAPHGGTRHRTEGDGESE
jgi:hypothetical protein